MQGDAKTRFEVYDLGIKNKILTPNECTRARRSPAARGRRRVPGGAGRDRIPNDPPAPAPARTTSTPRTRTAPRRFGARLGLSRSDRRDVEQTRTLAFEDAQIRASGSGSRQRFTFEGYAHTFGTLSSELREPGVNRSQPFRERVIGPEAVRETTREGRYSVRPESRSAALLGRTKSGTLDLSADEGASTSGASSRTRATRATTPSSCSAATPAK
jgi:hypothetical protein